MGEVECEMWRCVELELEIVKRKSEYEALEAKFRALEVEKLAMEEVIKALKRKSGGVEEQVGGGEDEKNRFCEGEKGTERVVDLTEDKWDEDKVFQLMIENKVLECEKKKAESEAESWKEKFKELESWILKLDKNLVFKAGELPLAGRMKVAGLGSPDVSSLGDSGTMQPNKRFKLQDGLYVDSSFGCSRDKVVVVDPVDIGSPSHSLGKGICNLQSAGTPSNCTPFKHCNGFKEENKGVCIESDMVYANSRQARKQLEFEEGSPCKKMAPSTPGGGIPSALSVINISDSDDELKLPTDCQGSKKICISPGSELGELVNCEKDTTKKNCLKPTHTDHNVEEDSDNSNEAFLLGSTPKRKRASNIVTSDSDSGDDTMPISKLKRMNLTGSSVTATASVADNVMDAVTPPRRRLARLRKGGAQRNYSSMTSETKHDQGVLTNEDVEDDELEAAGSESEGESLGGFIVNSSDVSEGSDASTGSEDFSDDNVNFDEILSKFQRNKDHKSKWEFEADMLSAFGKDPELCMKAVCALYRQQTSEEQFSKGTLCSNSRGFSKFDALRGSILAEFLTNGDANGDLKKTVKELEEYDPKAIEMCRTLASRYSKQLFEIYNNKEDPLFLPS